METRQTERLWRTVTLAAISIALVGTPFTYGQHGGGGNSSDRPRSDSTPYGSGSGGSSDKLSLPDPYGGQIYCPVTGTKLGLTQPPIAVQTTIGEEKPGFWGKLFGKKPTPGTVIYVCCPQCVDKVRSNTQAYLDEIVADKGCFSFCYGKAPAKRPPRAAGTP